MKEFKFNLFAFEKVWSKETIEGIVELIDDGIGYWATENSDECAPQLPLLMVVTECEALIGNEAPATHRIDLATITVGINRILNGSCAVNSLTIGNVAVFLATNELSYLDSEDMDLIVQAGLYNDIKWG